MFTGYYLNLERSTSRRERMLRHLEAIGAAGRYRRFPAIEGKSHPQAEETAMDPGSLGLWLTHEHLLRQNRDGRQHLHILEDDVVMPDRAVSLFDKVLTLADRTLPGWELLFTETFVPFDPELFRQLHIRLHAWHTRRGLTFIDLRQHYLCGITSVFISRQTVPKLLDLIEGQWRAGAPLDMHLRKLIRDGRLKAAVTAPFLSTYEPETSRRSDIRGALDSSHLATDLFRRSFYVNADLKELRKDMRDLLDGARVPGHAELFLDLMRFVVSDKWEPF